MSHRERLAYDRIACGCEVVLQQEALICAAVHAGRGVVVVQAEALARQAPWGRRGKHTGVRRGEQCVGVWTAARRGVQVEALPQCQYPRTGGQLHGRLHLERGAGHAEDAQVVHARRREGHRQLRRVAHQRLVRPRARSRLLDGGRQVQVRVALERREGQLQRCRCVWAGQLQLVELGGVGGHHAVPDDALGQHGAALSAMRRQAERQKEREHPPPRRPPQLTRHWANHSKQCRLVSHFTLARRGDTWYRGAQ